MRIRLDYVILLVLLMYELAAHAAPAALVEHASSGDGHYRRVQRKHRERHKHTHPGNDSDLTSTMKENGHRATKNTGRRERNQELCLTKPRSVELNTEAFEYDPPFYVEHRCQNLVNQDKGMQFVEQTCVRGLLRCVQRYAEVQTVRRPVGSSHWTPYLVKGVPSGCDCMWPADKLGPLDHHDDL